MTQKEIKEAIINSDVKTLLKIVEGGTAEEKLFFILETLEAVDTIRKIKNIIK